MNLHQMGAEKMPEKMPETFDSMRISSIFHNPSFTDSGNYLFFFDDYFTRND